MAKPPYATKGSVLLGISIWLSASGATLAQPPVPVVGWTTDRYNGQIFTWSVLVDGSVYWRTQFSGPPMFAGNFWGDGPTYPITGFNIQRDGSVLYLHVFTNLGYVFFNTLQPPAYQFCNGVAPCPPQFLGDFWSSGTVGTSRTTLGNLKSKYR